MAGYTFCFCFLFIYFYDSRQTNYLKIYPTDLGQIFRVDRTEIAFFRPLKERCQWLVAQPVRLTLGFALRSVGSL